MDKNSCRSGAQTVLLTEFASSPHGSYSLFHPGTFNCTAPIIHEAFIGAHSGFMTDNQNFTKNGNLLASLKAKLKSMKTNKYTHSIFLAIALLFFSCANDDPEPTDPTLTLQEKVDQYLNAHQSENSAGLSIAVRKDGIVTYRGNRGIAIANGAQPIGNDTQFRLGSISKPLTAIAIMKLVEEDRLNLSDRIMGLVPNLPESYAAITIEQLLSHRSGLLDYLDDIDDKRSLNNVKTSEVPGLLDGSGLERLQFAPGTSGDYSNTGYVLLALVIEELTGQTYPEYLAEVIFEPAGMIDSWVISEHEHMGDHGADYALSFGTTRNVFNFNSLIYGASGVVGSTNDLMRFASALLNGDIISMSSLQQMTTVRGPLPGIADYGLGWFSGSGNYWHTNFISDANDFFHTGGNDGYRTVLSFNPDLDLQIAILTNGGDTTQELMWGVMTLVREHYKQ